MSYPMCLKTGWYLVYPDGDKHFVSEYRWIARLSIWTGKKIGRSDDGFVQFLDSCHLEKVTVLQ